MVTQRARILRALAERGWDHVDDLETHEWWADEILVLESKWSPRDRRVLLIFLVDPVHEPPRSKGEAVWAVAAARDRPPDRAAVHEPVLSLGRGWEERLPEFLDAVDALRAKD
jgi:hypothetical protein